MAKFWKIIIQIMISIVILALGMLIGAWYGGNYATDFQFNGVRGYEATAQIGLLSAMVVLLILGFYYRPTKK